MKVSILRARRTLLAIGIGGLVVSAIGSTIDPREFFVSYLFGFLVWLGISLGCSGFLMIHHLTGGNWGYPVRRFFEAAIKTMAILAALVVPILFGLRQVYPWGNQAGMSMGKILERNQ